MGDLAEFLWEDAVTKKEERFPIVKECEGCDHRDGRNGNFCNVYRVPEGKWTGLRCPMATHTKKKAVVAGKELNPLKASKRKAKGK